MGPLAVLRARGAVLELHAHTLGEMLIREFVKASLADSGHYIGDDLGGEFLIDEVEKADEGMDVAQVQECGVFPPVPAFPTMIEGTLDEAKGTIEADSKRAQAMVEGCDRDSESEDEVEGIIVVDPERVQAKVVDMLEPVSVVDNDGAGSDRDSEMREDLVDKEVQGTIEADSERVQAMVEDMLEPVSVIDSDGAGLDVRRSWEATVAANQLAHARAAAAAACRHAQWRLEHDVLEGVPKGEVGSGGPVAAKGCGRERCGGHPTALGREDPHPKDSERLRVQHTKEDEGGDGPPVDADGTMALLDDLDLVAKALGLPGPEWSECLDAMRCHVVFDVERLAVCRDMVKKLQAEVRATP